MHTDNVFDLAIVGGGITGLTCAWHLTSRFPTCRYLLMEAETTCGGVLRSEQQGPYLCETSADSFLVTKSQTSVAELADELGIRQQLVGLRTEHQQAFVLRANRLYPVPKGFYLMAPRQVWPILSSKLLTWPGKLRLLAEPFLPPKKSDVDESLEDFACRRIGKNAYQWLAQPLISGIYAADPKTLSLAASLPQLVALEKEHGSLFRGLRKSQELASSASSGARYDMFMSCRGGMSTLVQSLLQHTSESGRRINAKVVQVFRSDDRIWNCQLESGSRVRSKGILLALPASQGATVLKKHHQHLANLLGHIPFGSLAVIHFAIRRESLSRELIGSGVVVPRIESRPILAISFLSNKFEQRCPENELLLRVFVGGVDGSHLLSRSDSELLEIAWRETRSILSIRSDPCFTRVDRWPNSTPQYLIGHNQRVDQINAAAQEIPGLFLAGKSYRGVGIPQCIRSAREATEKACAYLRNEDQTF